MGMLLLHQRMSHPNSSTSHRQEPPSSLQRIDHHHELWLHRGDTVYDVYQATIVLTLSFSASIESVMTCNSTQDFLYVWDSIDSRLIGESSHIIISIHLLVSPSAHHFLSIHQLHHHHHHEGSRYMIVVVVVFMIRLL